MDRIVQEKRNSQQQLLLCRIVSLAFLNFTRSDETHKQTLAKYMYFFPNCINGFDHRQMTFTRIISLTEVAITRLHLQYVYAEYEQEPL